MDMFAAKEMAFKIECLEKLSRTEDCIENIEAAKVTYANCLSILKNDMALQEAWKNHTDFDQWRNHDIGLATTAAFQMGIMENFVSLEDLMDWYIFIYKEASDEAKTV